MSVRKSDANDLQLDWMVNEGRLTIWHPDNICEKEGDSDLDGEWIMADGRDSWCVRSEMR